MHLTENRTSVLPIASTYAWESKPRRRFKRWLFRLLGRPVLP
jgi:hypothetical protein